MSASRGFLSSFEIVDIDLPDFFAPTDEAARNLSGLMTSGPVRHWLELLPELDLDEWAKNAFDEQVRVAMVHYSFLVQAYVWGEPEAPTKLPTNLARPMVALAERLGQAPLLPYSSYVLDNWTRMDREAPITLDNVRMGQKFYGGGMKTGLFWSVSRLKQRQARFSIWRADWLPRCKNQRRNWQQNSLTKCMIIGKRLTRYLTICRCAVIRIFISIGCGLTYGWANNPALPDGLIYEGVDKYDGEGQVFRGQFGSLSSIAPSIDVLFQVSHEHDLLGAYLDELHAYRPVQHRRYIMICVNNPNCAILP